MRAKITTQNQLTLPKVVMQAVGPSEYFDVQVSDGHMVLSSARIQRGDTMRARLPRTA